MQTYTREQLIKAMDKYNKQFINNPSDFSDITENENSAIEQVDHLLSLVEE